MISKDRREATLPSVQVSTSEFFASADDVFRDCDVAEDSAGRARSNTNDLVLSYHAISRSDSNITSQGVDLQRRDITTDVICVKKPSCRRSRRRQDWSRLFLMGGIVTSPLVPRKRATGIPLSMHADDYNYMRQSRSHEWSLASQSSDSDSTPNFKHGGKHACAYLNESMCHACCMNKKYQTFIGKLGKLYVLPEYQSEDNRIKITLRQYGNTDIPSHKKGTKPNINVRMRVVSGKVCYGKKVIKLEGSQRNEEFKFNYQSYFCVDSEEEARAARIELKLMYKKAFYNRWKVVNRATIVLDDIQVDPEESEEIRFY